MIGNVNHLLEENFEDLNQKSEDKNVIVNQMISILEEGFNAAADQNELDEIKQAPTSQMTFKRLATVKRDAGFDKIKIDVEQRSVDEYLFDGSSDMSDDD
jgi:hypothetical protein|tara:strand:- start:3 stop:302 length:300 start_codon:yes stop_codon:yes gene_type:complete